jgi:RimJ/RimL family protein N-acetyltransferase
VPRSPEAASAASSAGFALRPWRPADRAACLALLDANSPRFFGPSDRADYLRFLANPDRPYWVMIGSDPSAADAGAGTGTGTVVGCGGAAVAPVERVGFLTYGMVDPTRHGQGLGTLLTRFRLRWLAAQPGIDRVLIDTSNETEGFYARFGFRTLRVIRDAYAPGLHQHDMELRLDAARRRALLGSAAGLSRRAGRSSRSGPGCRAAAESR